MRNPGAGHDNGSNIASAAVPEANTKETLGIKYHSNGATFTQIRRSASDGTPTTATDNDSNIKFSSSDNVYIGLLVSSNNTTASTLTISELRIKLAAGEDYTVIDLSAIAP
jgi:putative salt-induced outer membrane protein YdiY